MDYDKLIERLNDPDCCDKCTYEEKRACAGSAKCVLSEYSAAALSTLRAENAQLRGELEYEQEHANAYYEECGQWEAENEKLKDQLYDGEGVNLVNYWMQQAKIEENGHRNCQAENEQLRSDLRRLQTERDTLLAANQHLLAEREQLTAEMDAAIEDLKRIKHGNS